MQTHRDMLRWIKCVSLNIITQASSLKPQASSLIGLMLLLWGCLFSLTTPAQDVLRVYNFHEYIDMSVLEDFKNETGMQVDYYTFGSANDVRGLIEQKTPIDVAVISHFLLPRLMEEKLLEKLNPVLLPNIANFDPFMLSRVNLAGAKNHALPYLWYTTLLGVNQGKIKKALAGSYKENWELLFDLSKNSRAKECGIAMTDAPVELYTALLNYAGSQGSLAENIPLNRIKRLSKDILFPIRNNLLYIDSNRYAHDLSAGKLCLVLGWSGAVFQAAKENSDIKIISSEKDALIMAFDALIIPKNSKNVEGAHRFINFLSRPDISARNVNKILYGSPLKSIRPLLETTLQNNTLLYVDEKNKSRMQLLESPGKAQQAVIDELWDDFVNNRGL